MSAIIKRIPLEMFWPTSDPFLFCAFHNDSYPAGNGEQGPAASLAGRPIGQDFHGIDGWRMYHGDRVPGFPCHPHRGFETVTVVNKGYIDHADSIGAAGRYGEGDTQWMTAGKGVQHSEMFPLLHEDQTNPLELFQIWLNLPRKNKMVPPHFGMLWNEKIPVVKQADSAGIETKVKLISGTYGEQKALACPPDSWAADPENEVAIWQIDMPENAEWDLPKASAGLSRTIYFFEGKSTDFDGTSIKVKEALQLKSDQSVHLKNTGTAARFLLLQGRPIGEPVEQHGPFVMNTRQELQTAFNDYQRTQFGGWPWSRPDQVHGKEIRRFAIHGAGQKEEIPSA